MNKNFNDATRKTASAVSEQTSFADELYGEINKVLGGTNANQFLCLTIPGQALSAEDYSYDYKNNAAKGPTVEANESKLANKMFDPCTMTGSDNGKTLAQQYRSALDMLSPKLNGRVASAKHKLRELLMSEYPYDISTESEEKNADGRAHTLQEVYFSLYDEYIEAQKRWAMLQSEKKAELKRKYITDEKNATQNTAYNNAYLEWYETEAESHLNEINEKMSKLISVFTPNDMKILEGMLDSGSGAEIQEARQTLNNFKKLTPNGGYVYPVKFQPANWFELLNTSFTPIDLLKTPEALAMQMQSLTSRKIKINSQIQSITAMLPNASEVQSALKALENAQEKIDTAQDALVEKYGENIKTVFNAVLDLAPVFSAGIPTDIVAKLIGGSGIKEGKKISDLAIDLVNADGELNKAQTAYVSATQQLSDAIANSSQIKNSENLRKVLDPLNEQLSELEEQLSILKTELQLSSATRPQADENGVVKDSDTDENAVAPASVPNGYTQVVIATSAASLNNKSTQSTDASVHTGGIRFLFGGVSRSSNSSDSQSSLMNEASKMDIQIGMNVAKVGIERDWFNPGVFSLTKDMFNVTTQRISPQNDYAEVNKKRLEDMAKTAFPCYPTAMVIARDISVKFVSEDSISEEFSKSMEQHASTGGGFLFFSGSSSSSRSSSESGINSQSTSNSVTLKFTSPQIIGYYMEAVAPDKSLFIDQITSDEAAAGYVTIEQFVKDYKRVLDNMKNRNAE